MNRKLLLLWGLLTGLNCLAQTAPDRIYLLDQQVMQVWVDEIGENDILYFSKGEPPRQIQKIARSLVWKVVFANGDTERIQPDPAGSATVAVVPAIVKFDHIHTRSNTILEGKIIRVGTTELVYIPMGQQNPRSFPMREVLKIVYSDGRTDSFEATEAPPATLEAPPVKETRVRPKSRKYLGLLAGGVASSFYREAFFPFPQKAHLDWEAGLAGSVVSTRFYQARLELLYTQKGAVETFQSSRLTIRSESRLTCLQANALPLILKTGSNRLNVALGAGGYFSYLIRAESRSDLGSGEMQDDPLAREQFDVPTDYGLMGLLGLYVRHKPVLEVRYSHGLGQLMTNTPIRMQGVHVSLFLIF